MLLAVAFVAALLAISVPVYCTLTFDHVGFAKQKLDSKNGGIIEPRDKIGTSVACVDLSDLNISNDDLQ